MPEYKMRKWYWDMEWQQGGDYHDQLTTIVVYDNYDEEYLSMGRGFPMNLKKIE